jgi:predicted outer membrane protein
MNTVCGKLTRVALVGTPLVALCLVGLAVAQGTRPQPVPPQAGARENIDRPLALEVALANDNEIALAKIAQTRAANKDVVKFAEMLQKDHEQFGQELQRFAGDISALREHLEKRPADGRRNPDGAAGADAGAANRRDAVAPQAGTAPRAGAAPGNPRQPGPMNVFEQIKIELADACLESTQRELQDKKDAEFDKCYVGMQVGAHMKMIDTLTVFEKHASPELQRAFHKGLQTSQKHLDAAKKLMKDVDDVRTAGRDKNS